MSAVSLFAFILNVMQALSHAGPYTPRYPLLRYVRNSRSALSIKRVSPVTGSDCRIAIWNFLFAPQYGRNTCGRGSAPAFSSYIRTLHFTAARCYSVLSPAAE